MSFSSRAGNWQKGVVWLAVVGMLGGLFTNAAGTDRASAAAADPGRTDYSVSADQLVWLEKDAAGIKQVHALNQSSGVKQAVTSGSSAKDAPAVSGNIAVWADKGNEAETSLNWDIYSADLRNGTRTKLNKTPGQYGNPSTDGVGVVWYERKHYGSMIYHDLASGVEADLGEGRFPVLVNGNVVYRNARNGGLSLLNLSSGSTRSLVSLGGANFVDWFVFNGSYVLWKQKNGASESQYVQMSTKDLTAVPVELTPMSAAGTEYAFMSIGDGQAVFQMEQSGVPVLRVVNLSTQEVTTLPALAAGAKLIGVSGDKLLYSTKDDYIESVPLVKAGSPTPDPTPAPNPGAAPDSGHTSGGGTAPAVQTPLVTGIKDSLVMGPQGGMLSAANGSARLEIAAGTFPENTVVSLAQAELATGDLLDPNGRKLRKTGAGWQVQASAPFGKPGLLAIGYSKEEPWTSSREKLGIYSYDSVAGNWSYIGGVTAVEDGYVRAKITEPGLYAVLLREIEFSDMTSHWARQQAEVLAARGIAEGMGHNIYAPKGTLTRAQFTKLLAAALQLQPLQPDVPTFSDVASTNWSYGWVEAAAAAGIVTGDAGLFRGNDPLTREQMMVMLIRAIEGSTGAPAATGSSELESQLASFKDKGSISGWARNSVAVAIDKKLVQGDGQFLYPKQYSTRAEAAILIYKLLTELKLL